MHTQRVEMKELETRQSQHTTSWNSLLHTQLQELLIAPHLDDAVVATIHRLCELVAGHGSSSTHLWFRLALLVPGAAKKVILFDVPSKVYRLCLHGLRGLSNSSFCPSVTPPIWPSVSLTRCTRARLSSSFPAV